MVNPVAKTVSANRGTVKIIFAAPGDKLVVRIIPIATKTIIASKKHIIAGINGLWIRPAAIMAKLCA